LGRLFALPRRLRPWRASKPEPVETDGYDAEGYDFADRDREAYDQSVEVTPGRVEPEFVAPAYREPDYRDPGNGESDDHRAGDHGSDYRASDYRALDYEQPAEPADYRPPGVDAPGEDTSGDFDWSAFDQRVAVTSVEAGEANIEPIRGEGWLEVHGVRKSFKSRPVVKGVSLAVHRGEVVGLLGPNGAGKTTVFYMITGLIGADSGQIAFDGRDITRLPMYRRARLGIGYLPQEPSIFRGLTVEQNIRAVLEITEPNRARRAEELDSLLEEFAIARLRKSPAIALSGGERRRVEIARALASRPAFMLLDEPFAGIDPIAVGDIRALVRHLSARGIGVLITDHNVRETLGLIDRAYIIHDGQVLMQGTPNEVVAHGDVRRFYLGDEFRM
jgi:lipopolysaccharide export system ATP-binding protein